MYIEPNGICHLLSGVPLDNTYEHTLWFDLDNVRSQYDYFISKKKHTLTGMSYTRYKEGVIVVERVADQLYDCNYLMFQNTGYGNKWFYAFITNVEYVNNVTSYVYFQIDVMQTWHFDYTPKQCFIEREHSVTDEIGDNLVPENLEKGDYITTNYKHHTTELFLFAFVTENITEIPSEPPKIIGGLPIPCYTLYIGRVAGEDTTLRLHQLTNLYSQAGKAESIVAIFTAPADFVTTNEGVTIQHYSVANRVISKTPKNNKLYTYPYVSLVLNFGGNACELKYELFDETPSVQSVCSFAPATKVAFIPENYAGDKLCFDRTISGGNYPLCAWVTDYYQQWLARNGYRNYVSTVSAVGGLLSSATQIGVNAVQSGMSIAGTGTHITAPQGVSSGASSIGNFINSASQVAQVIEDKYQAQIIPNQLSGQVEAGDSLTCGNLSGLYTYCRSIRPEFVTIIDEYFTRYGYATHRTKHPNRNSRPHFNYVKTVRATLTGSVPADDMRVICSIYDAGVTFWKNGNEVGDYTLDNRP